MSEAPHCPKCNGSLDPLSAYDRQALAIANDFAWVCSQCRTVGDGIQMLSVESVKAQERAHYLAIVQSFRTIETPKTLREWCEGLRAALATDSTVRYAWANVGPELLRALWEAMERIGGTIPSRPDRLRSDKLSVNEPFIQDVLQGIADVAQWCEERQTEGNGGNIIVAEANKCKILFLAANPEDTNSLALGEESREIEQKIRAAEYRDSLELVTKWAVRPDDLLQYLNQFRPQVVHFSGHGSEAEEIVLMDANRRPVAVSKDAMKHLFLTLKDNIRVVVLNACHSQAQAEAIVEVIDCAIGMKRAIGDKAAIAFAASFYRAVGFGRSVHEACEQGQTALMLEGIPEQDAPKLLTRCGVDPKTIFLVTRANP